MLEGGGSPQGHIVIVGAGHAGGTVATLLRQYRYAGPITLIGDEPIAPYQRPPLSKGLLKGEVDLEALLLKPQTFYGQRDIELRLGECVRRIDRESKAILFSDGSRRPYDLLILAMGARPISLSLPGKHLDGVLALRTAADTAALRPRLGPGKRLAVVGGGYIGLEVAASARALRAEVVVIEREPRLLARVACETLSNFFQGYHQSHGVRFELSANVVGFAGEAAVEGVVLADGRTIPCHVAVVGVGVRANEELARDAGLDVADGIVVDLNARTSDPNIYAIGDVTRRPMPIYGRLHRLESVPNAVEQAKQAACAIVGRPPPTGEVPWQWSDQYDLKLQIAGFPFDADRRVVRGEVDAGGFAIFHFAGDRLRAVEAINAPGEFAAGRQLIASGHAVDVSDLIDPATAMQDIVRAATARPTDHEPAAT